MLRLSKELKERMEQSIKHEEMRAEMRKLQAKMTELKNLVDKMKNSQQQSNSRQNLVSSKMRYRKLPDNSKILGGRRKIKKKQLTREHWMNSMKQQNNH